MAYNRSEGGGSVPFTPSGELPFIGNTRPTGLNGTGWSYPNPFNFNSSFGVTPDTSAPVMSVPWSGSVSSMNSNLLLSQMTSVPLSSAFSTNTTTKDMRTNHTIPYARAQNTEQAGFDFWKGYVEGCPIFLFTGQPFASPFGVFDPEASFYLTKGRPRGFSLGDAYESYFTEHPLAGFSSDYTLPQVNFLLASSEISRTAYGGERGPGCYSKYDVERMYSFDGVVWNQEGGENPATGTMDDPGKGIIYNMVREGTHRNTKNVFGNEAGVQDMLWFVCKRMSPPKNGYRLNPNDTRMYFPQIPEAVSNGLPEEDREVYLSARCSRPWQFVPWFSKIKGRPTDEDLEFVDEFGIPGRGFAVPVGLNRHETPIINEEVIRMGRTDAHAMVKAEGLEIYLDQGKLNIM